ncbi:3-phosphoserine/phosphohydroxythreonine transaminase [Heliophilum fasciatum]|uniref:Phosphoserine aminotransferase n=1 Tax=Heliophilum fasciatum TaxID=35700 RepID=A0A4R2RF30_9FIRM|nr:3-phosphoserine/phosphohydroxythreonine transaminase [Heliophilum fasciatum]MCW2279076.1 phosphoserine aminotransferase [Heliophilum fasciatum]TCP61473.1 phosphoserine aminotransferase [Heliophilum fasciatum]
MTNRVYNFNAGPSTLPLEVLQQAQEELLNYQGTGMSVMEISHRAKEYEAINAEAEASLKELLNLGDDYRVLFLQGGASTQFTMIPMNFLTPEKTADYILTGAWSEKAQKEAVKFGQVHVAASTQEGNYVRIPEFNEIKLSEAPAYVHLTSNNTIFGTQWQEFPGFGDVPLIADMSSDILSHPFDASKFSLIYAGAQKNLGPSGVTVVIIRQSMIDQAPKSLPSMLRYDIHAKNNSLYNTPPTFSVYMVNLVLRWLKAQGGLTAIGQHNEAKAALIYDAIDQSSGFYTGHAEKNSRSRMNITFRLPSEELEKAFNAEATKQGMIGLKGHRSVGGMRASTYNAMPLAGCQALADFMKDFQRRNG